MNELSKECVLAFSFFSRIPGYRVGCYYCLFQQEKPLPQIASMDSEQKSSEYVVCFLGGSEKGLELYPFFVLWGYQEGNAGRQVEDDHCQPPKSLSTSYAWTSISYLHMTTCFIMNLFIFGHSACMILVPLPGIETEPSGGESMEY